MSGGPLNVIDLFSGLGGWSAAFRDRGHSVTTLDLDPRFGADFIVDLLDVRDLNELGGPFDVVLASPPCECFSVMTIGKNWTGGPKGYIPRRPQAEAALRLAHHTFALIERAQPRWYVIENPRGMLRKVAPRPPDATTWYCLAGETRVLTRGGTAPIRDLVGQTPELLTTGGEWVAAPVRAFGAQSLMCVTLSRIGSVKQIRATPDHRWILANGTRVATSDLKEGQLLAASYPKRQWVQPSDDGIARGFVFGDGYIQRSVKQRAYAIAQFVGAKDDALAPYYVGRGHRPVRSGVMRRVGGLPTEWKMDPPRATDDPALICGWLAGYFAADGSVAKRWGTATIWSARRENLDAVRTLAAAIGLGTYSIGVNWRKGYGTEETPLYSVAFMRSDLTADFFVLDHHRQRFIEAGPACHQARRWTIVSVDPTPDVEDVFCATVTGTEAFALEDNILTGNCRWGMPYAKPTDLWTNLNGGMAMGWPTCRNGGPDHPYTPRGDKHASVQGTSAQRERRRLLLQGERVNGYRLVSRRRNGREYLTVERTGTNLANRVTGQNMNGPKRALIPYRLSLAVALACEDDGRLPNVGEVEEIESIGRGIVEAEAYAG